MLSFRSVCVGGAVPHCILQHIFVAPKGRRATLVRSYNVSSGIKVGQVVKTAFQLKNIGS